MPLPNQDPDPAYPNESSEPYQEKYADPIYDNESSYFMIASGGEPMQDYISVEILPILNSEDMGEVAYALQWALEAGLFLTCTCWQHCQCYQCGTSY
jgi:hypothetical protein